MCFGNDKVSDAAAFDMIKNLQLILFDFRGKDWFDGFYELLEKRSDTIVFA